MSKTDSLNVLTMAERDTLAECEKIVERGQQTFVEVGLALAKIRDRKLYRVGHATFEEYCEKRWNWKRAYAHRMVQAAEAVQGLPPRQSSMVDNPRQAAALAAVPKEKRAEVVEEAAKAGPVTAKSIEAAAERIQEAEVVHRDHTDAEREVPADVVPLWLKAEEACRDLQPLVAKLKAAFKAGIETREETLVFAECNNTDLTPVQQVANTLALHVKPHAVCPTCNGTASRKKCKLCRGRGYVGKHLWTACVDEETKALLAKSAKK